MIRGLHAMFYSPEAEELRTFFRDKLKFPFVDTGTRSIVGHVATRDRRENAREAIPLSKAP